jgi:hypothetical protein
MAVGFKQTAMMDWASSIPIIKELGRERSCSSATVACAPRVRTPQCLSHRPRRRRTVPAAVAPQALLASFDRATPNNFEDAPLDPELPTSFDKDDQDDLVGD